MCVAVPGQAALGSIRKQAEQAMESKPVSSIFPLLTSVFLSVSCPDFL